MARRYYREGDELIPGYRLVDYLGRGGFGQVWKATGPGGIEVALKIIDDLGRKKGGKELKALRLLKGIRHPNLVPVTAFWLKDAEGNVIDEEEAAPQEPPDAQADRLRGTMQIGAAATAQRQPDVLIVAMGLAEKSLFDRMEECQQQGLPGIAQPELIDYMEDSAKAIDLLNSRHNIQHCDIKPQNILILSGAAQVCDFGLAKAIGDLRESSMAAGTIAYGAPEVFSGRGPCPTTDQYSLAISYFELRTGHLPFRGENISQVLDAKRHGGLELSRISEPERQVIARATALSPEDRFPTTMKMVRALRRCCPEDGTIDTEGPARGVTPSSSVELGEIVPGYHRVQLLHQEQDEEVWEATAPGKKHVAVVIQDLSKSSGEVDLAALTMIHNLRHPHLGEPHAFWLLDGTGAVISESLLSSPGAATPAKLVMAGKLAPSTLKHRLEHCRVTSGMGIPPAELLFYMRQIADAVDFLNPPQHRLGERMVAMQHGNLRPINFMLDDSTVIVGNLARVTILEGETVRQPRPTVRDEPWMAPEARQASPGRWSDQYALAAAYLEMRTARPPSPGEPDLSGLPPEEVDVIRRAMAASATDRFESCTALVEALCQACQVVPAPPAERPAPDTASAASTSATEPPDITRTADVRPERHHAVTEVLPSGQLDDIAKTDDFSIVDTHAGDSDRLPQLPPAQPVDLQVPAPPPPAVRRKRPIGAMAALAAVLLVAGGAMVPLAKSFQFDREVRTLIEDGQYEPAGQRIDAAAAWYRWLVDQEALRGDLQQQWLAAAQDQLDQDDSLAAGNTLENLLKVFPDHDSAEVLLSKIRASSPRESRPEVDPKVLLTAVEDSLRQAQVKLDAEPQESISASDEAIGRLDELPSLPSGASRQRASNLRRQILLVGARANARLDEWENVRRGLAQLEKTLNDGELQDPVHSGLLVLADYSVPSRELAAPDRLLERLESHRQALGAVQSTSQIADAQWEQDQIKRLVQRHASPLKEWLRRDAAQPPETRLKFCETLLAYLPADRTTLEIQAGLKEQINELARPASSDARDKIVAAIDKPTRPNYAALLKDIEALPQKDRADGLIQTFRAECLIEAAGPSALTCRSWRQARDIALEGGATVQADYRPYQLYVQALVYQTDPAGSRSRQAAELMARALADDPIPATLKGHRRTTAANIFESGATRLRTAAAERSFLEMLESPYPNPQDAGTALAWLAKADKLVGGDQQSPSVKKERALAAWYKQPPDAQLAGRLARDVIDERGGRPIERGDLPILYVLARSLGDDDSGRSTAIESYAEILNLLEQEPSPGADDVAPLELYEKVVGPAVTLAEGLSGPGGLSGGQRRRVGTVYAAKGRLLRENQYENWEFDQPNQEMFDAYSKAIEYDSSRPQYHVGRGYSRMKLADVDLAALRTDADNAIKQDKEYPGGHALLGNVLILQSRREGDMRRRTPLLEKAVQECTLAVDQSEQDDPDRANYFINRSAAYLEWANFTVDPTLKRQADLLERARSDAKRAAEMESVYQDYAYRALGNALEDLAWIAGKTEHYPEAVEAFSRAIDLRGDLATAWMDRGRCHFKSVAHGGLADDRLDAAVRDLNEAIDRRAEMAEAHLWLGRVHHHRGEHDEADRALASALKIDPSYHPAAFWKANVAVARARYDMADALFEQAVNSAGQEKSVQRLAYLVEWARTIPPTALQSKRVAPLRAAADRLAGDAAPEAGLFVALVRRMEERWDEAIEACDGALEGQPTVPGVRALVYLARSQTRYFSPQASADLKKVDSLIVRDAEQATRLAADANTKAIALSQAAQARSKAANALGTAGGQRTAALRRQAVDDYRQAIKLAPDHPQGWGWRMLLYTSWVTVEPRLHEDNAKFNEANRHLDEAFNRAPTRDWKDRIGRMRQSLKANRGP